MLREAFADGIFDAGLIYIVMELCGPSLVDSLGEPPYDDEFVLGRVFREMLLGIHHVHEVSIVHRDVKPDNFLLGGEHKKTIKLIDFGLSARIPKEGGLKGHYGTAPYMSPEMVSDSSYSEATDIWSLGATVYVCLYGDLPYLPPESFSNEGRVDSNVIRHAIMVGEPKPTFAPSSEGCLAPSLSATAFARALLDRVPESRCTAYQALQLPFVQSEEQRQSARVDDDAVRRSISFTASLMNSRQQINRFRTRVNPADMKEIDDVLHKPETGADLYEAGTEEMVESLVATETVGTVDGVKLSVAS